MLFASLRYLILLTPQTCRTVASPPYSGGLEVTSRLGAHCSPLLQDRRVATSHYAPDRHLPQAYPPKSFLTRDATQRAVLRAKSYGEPHLSLLSLAQVSSDLQRQCSTKNTLLRNLHVSYTINSAFGFQGDDINTNRQMEQQQSPA